MGREWVGKVEIFASLRQGNFLPLEVCFHDFQRTLLDVEIEELTDVLLRDLLGDCEVYNPSRVPLTSTPFFLLGL